MSIAAIKVYPSDPASEPVVLDGGTSGFINMEGLFKLSISQSNCIDIRTSESDNLFKLAADQYIVMHDGHSDSSPRYISSINNVVTQTGNIDILGSMCNSVYTYSDSFVDPQSMADATQHSNALYIFDGCKPCNDCQKIWDLRERIRDCQLWINTLKDSILRRQLTGDGLARQMSLIRDWKYVDPSDSTRAAALSTVPANVKQAKFTVHESDSQLKSAIYHCPIINTEHTAQQIVKPAVDMLREYRAMVALWNYLAQNITDKTQITTTQEDFSGINVCVQKVVNMCNLQSDSVSQTNWPAVRIYAGITSGQQSETATVTGGTVNNIANSDSGIAINVSVISDNTYPAGNSYIYSKRAYCCLQKRFNPNGLEGQQTLAAGVKVLPVWLTSDQMSQSTYRACVPGGTYSSGAHYHEYETLGQKHPVGSDNLYTMSLDAYINRRQTRTQISTEQQASKNQWTVTVVWFNIPGSDDSQVYTQEIKLIGGTKSGFYKEQDYLYSTPYTRKPETQT